MTTALYVENGVGRRINNAIAVFEHNHGVSVYFQHDVHPEMQRRQKGDSWWIEDITRRGMAILTQDLAILSDEAERETARLTRARIIALGRGEYPLWDKLRCVTTHWGAVERLLAGDGGEVLTLYLSRSELEAL